MRPFAKPESGSSRLLVSRGPRHAIYLRRNERNAENLERVIAYYEREGVPFDRNRGLDVKAVIDARPVEAELSLDLPENEPLYRFVASFWARAKVNDLLRQHPVGSGDPNRSEIVALSLAHRFMTPYTAFLSLPNKERQRLSLGPMPEDDREGLRSYLGSGFERILAADADALEKEAEECFERVIVEFPVTALTPSSRVPLAAQSRDDPLPYNLPPTITRGVPSSAYFIAAS